MPFNKIAEAGTWDARGIFCGKTQADDKPKRHAGFISRFVSRWNLLFSRKMFKRKLQALGFPNPDLFNSAGRYTDSMYQELTDVNTYLNK